MSLLSEYLKKIKKTQLIGNSIDFSDALKNSHQHFYDKESKLNASNSKPLKMPYEIVQEYLRYEIKKNKHIYNLISCALAERWRNPSRARECFTEARRIINNRIISGEPVSDGEYYFVRFFFSLEDLIAYYPALKDFDASDYENHEKSTEKFKSEMEEYKKNAKKQFKEYIEGE